MAFVLHDEQYVEWLSGCNHNWDVVWSSKCWHKGC